MSFVWTTVPHIVYNMPCMKNSLSYSSHTHLKLLCIYGNDGHKRKKNINKIITQNQHYYYRKAQKNIIRLVFFFMKHTILLLHSSFVINQRGWRSPTRHTLLFFSYSIFSCYYIAFHRVSFNSYNHTCSLEQQVRQ